MSGPDKHACLTVLADDGDKLDVFREALSGIPRIRVAERLQSGGADLAWALAIRPVVQILRLDLCPGPVAASGEARHLSAREVDVLRLLAQGHSYDEIGGQLGVTLNTVASHIKSAYRKLSVHSAAAAVMRAVELRLIGVLGKL
jgi:DNA-binding CsgD family transcriptional regulator